MGNFNVHGGCWKRKENDILRSVKQCHRGHYVFSLEFPSFGMWSKVSAVNFDIHSGCRRRKESDFQGA